MAYLMRKGSLYDVEDALDILMGYSVILIGEEHGSGVSQHAELSMKDRSRVADFIWVEG